MAKVIVMRQFFVALLDDGGGNALLVETPASMLDLGGKEPALLRLNRRHLPEVATGGEPVLVGDLVQSTTATDTTPKGAVSITMDLEFLGRVAGLSPGARVSQAAKGGASADVVARIARSMLLERPEAVDLPGTRWVVADPSDQPALAGKVLTVVSVDVFEAVVEVINAAGEYVDKDRAIPLEWLDTVLTRVEK